MNLLSTDETINDLRHIAVIHAGRIRHECLLEAADRLEAVKAAIAEYDAVSDYHAADPHILFKCVSAIAKAVQ